MDISFVKIPAQDAHWYVKTPDGLIISYFKAPEDERDDWPLYKSTTKITGMIPKTKDFEKWLGNQPSYEAAQSYMKERGRIGSICHDAMEFINNDPKKILDRREYTDEQWDLIYGFWRAHEELEITPVSVEERLHDDDDMTAGTSDLYGKVGSEYWMCDYKTSKSIYHSHCVQVHKYGRMKQKLGKPVDRLCVIRATGKGGKGYELKIFDFDEEFDKDFAYALHFHKRLYPRDKPKLKEVPETLSLEMI